MTFISGINAVSFGVQDKRPGHLRLRSDAAGTPSSFNKAGRTPSRKPKNTQDQRRGRRQGPMG